MADNLTEDGLPILSKASNVESDVTEDGLPILKKKVDTESVSTGVKPSVSEVPSTSKPTDYNKDNVKKLHLADRKIAGDKLAEAFKKNDSEAFQNTYIDYLTKQGYDKNELLQKKNEIAEGKRLVEKNQILPYRPQSYPVTPEQTYDLGRGQLMLGDNDAAIKSFEQTLQNKKEAKTPERQVTQIGNETSISDQQELKYNAAENPANSLYGIGLAYLNKKEDANATNFFVEALKVDPSNASAMLGLANVMDKQGNKEESKKLISDAAQQYKREGLALQYDAERTDDIEKQRRSEQIKDIADGLEKFATGDLKGELGSAGKLTPWGFAFHTAKEMGLGILQGAELVNKGVEKLIKGEEMGAGVVEAAAGAGRAYFSSLIPVALFNNAVQPIKEAAEKNPDNKTLGVISEAIDVPFSLVSHVAEWTGHELKEGSTSQLASELGDIIFAVGAGTIAGKKIKDIKDYTETLKDISDKAQKGEDVTKQMQEVKAFADGIKKITEDQLRLEAEKQGKKAVIESLEKVDMPRRDLSPKLKELTDELSKEQKIKDDLDKMDGLDESKQANSQKIEELNTQIESENAKESDARITETEKAAKQGELQAAIESPDISIETKEALKQQLETIKGENKNIAEIPSEVIEGKDPIQAEPIKVEGEENIEPPSPENGEVRSEKSIRDDSGSISDTATIPEFEYETRIDKAGNKYFVKKEIKTGEEKFITEEVYNKEKLKTGDAIDVKVDKLSDKAQSLLDNSIEQFEMASESEKVDLINKVKENLNRNKEGDKIGFPLDKDAVVAGEEFLKRIESQPSKETMRHADTAKKREQLGLKEREKVEFKTAEEIDKEAERRIKDGVDIDEIISKVEKSKGDVGVERSVLIKAKGVIEAEIKKLSGEEKNKKITELEKIIDAVEVANSVAGKELQHIQEATKIDDSLGSYLVETKKASKVENLTDEQIKTAEKLQTEYEQAKDSWEKKNADLEARISKLEAQKGVDRITKTARRLAKGAKIEEIKSVRSKILEDLKNSRKKATPDEPVRHGSVISDTQVKLIAELVDTYVRELAIKGSIKLEDVVDGTYNALNGIIDGITKKDVTDIIAGKYSKKKTLNELSEMKRNLREEAKLLDELDKLEKGEVPKKESKLVKYNQRLTELREKLKELKKEKGINDEEKLISAKTRIEKSIKEIERQIKEKDFAPKKTTPLEYREDLKRKFPDTFKKLEDAYIKKEDAAHKKALEIYKIEQENRSKPKIVSDIAKGIIATSKAISAGIDFSGILVQNGLAVMANPTKGIPAVGKSFYDFADTYRANFKKAESSYERDLASLHNSPDYHIIRESGLDINDPKSLRDKNREEVFSGNLIDKDYKVLGVEINPGKWITRPFEIAYTSLGNNLRVNLFRERAQQLERAGIPFNEKNKKQYEDAAKVINTMTGRGYLHPLVKGASPLITPVIWSPTLMSSTMNILGLSDVGFGLAGKKGYYSSLTKEQRAYAVSQTLRGVSMGASLMAVAAYAGADVDYDPTSVTFGTVQFKDGGNRYSVFGRFTPYVRLAVMTATGTKKIANKTIPVDEAKELRGFVRGKVTPFAGALTDLATGRMYDGSEFDWKEEGKNLIMPMSFNDQLSHGIKQEGLDSWFTRFIPSIVGMKVSNERDFTGDVYAVKKDENRKLFKDMGYSHKEFKKTNLYGYDAKKVSKDAIGDLKKAVTNVMSIELSKEDREEISKKINQRAEDMLDEARKNKTKIPLKTLNNNLIRIKVGKSIEEMNPEEFSRAMNNIYTKAKDEVLKESYPDLIVSETKIEDVKSLNDKRIKTLIHLKKKK